VGQLLDVLDDVPSLGLIDSFSRLLVSRLVSADVTAEDREIALVGLIKRACAAHAATQVSGDTDRKGDGDDIDSPEPDSKVARLA
jgi:hypothetical protein